NRSLQVIDNLVHARQQSPTVATALTLSNERGHAHGPDDYAWRTSAFSPIMAYVQHWMGAPMQYSPDAIRTVALIGHAGCGTTSLVEALLHKGGAVHTPGSVERGTTVCDFDPLERKYHHSLNSAVVHLHHRNTRIYMLDTPGYPDFSGQSISALPAVET